MIYEILYEDRVDNDIDEALDYYFPINVELSDAFLDRVEEAKLLFWQLYTLKVDQRKSARFKSN